MAPTTPDLTPDQPERALAHTASSAAVAEEAERYLAARLARWLADVAMASAVMAPADDELDDAA